MDELRDALSAAYDKAEETPSAEVSERVPDTGDNGGDTNVVEVVAEQQDARARDEQGRFAKAEEAKPRETLTLKGKPNAAKEQERAPEAKAPVEAVSGQLAAVANGNANRPAQPGDNAAGNGGSPIPPPAHWNGREKIEWERLPYHVKQTLAQEYESVSQLRGLNQALAPHAEIFSREFGGADRALTQILGTWNYARTQPLAFAREFMQRYGIDPQTLIGVASGAQPGQAGDNAPQYVTREDLAAIQARERQEAEARAAASQIQTEVDAFASSVNPDGSLAYPYLNDVRPIMAGLFGSGAARNLKEAYEMACRANPQISATMAAVQEAKQAAERRRAADQARGAAASIAGSPGHRGPGRAQNETADQTLNRVYEQLASGGRA